MAIEDDGLTIPESPSEAGRRIFCEMMVSLAADDGFEAQIARASSLNSADRFNALIRNPPPLGWHGAWWLP